MIGKAEHLPRGANPRFVVTSLGAKRIAARALYEEVYCARGDMENRIKEQQLALFADRTSAQTMRANQLRLYFALDRLRAAGVTVALGPVGHAAGAGAMRHDPPEAAQDRRADPGQRAGRAAVVRRGLPGSGPLSGRCWPVSRACPCAVSNCTPAIVLSSVGGAGDQCVCRAGCKQKQGPNNRGSGDPYQASARIRRPTQHCQAIHPPQMDKTSPNLRLLRRSG